MCIYPYTHRQNTDAQTGILGTLFICLFVLLTSHPRVSTLARTHTHCYVNSIPHGCVNQCDPFSLSTSVLLSVTNIDTDIFKMLPVNWKNTQSHLRVYILLCVLLVLLSACQCSGPGCLDGSCDFVTGHGVCRSGFQGYECDQCAPGYFNYPLCQCES